MSQYKVAKGYENKTFAFGPRTIDLARATEAELEALYNMNSPAVELIIDDTDNAVAVQSVNTDTDTETDITPITDVAGTKKPKNPRNTDIAS